MSADDKAFPCPGAAGPGQAAAAKELKAVSAGDYLLNAVFAAFVFYSPLMSWPLFSLCHPFLLLIIALLFRFSLHLIWVLDLDWVGLPWPARPGVVFVGWVGPGCRRAPMGPVVHFYTWAHWTTSRSSLLIEALWTNQGLCLPSPFPSSLPHPLYNAPTPDPLVGDLRFRNCWANNGRSAIRVSLGRVIACVTPLGRHHHSLLDCFRFFSLRFPWFDRVRVIVFVLAVEAAKLSLYPGFSSCSSV